MIRDSMMMKNLIKNKIDMLIQGFDAALRSLFQDYDKKQLLYLADIPVRHWCLMKIGRIF